MFAVLFLTSALASTSSLKTRLDQAILPQIGKTHMGAIVGVLENQKEIFYGYGKISEQSSQKPNSKTIFRIGSISKTFVTLVFLEAVRKGYLSQSEELGEIRKEWKGQKLSHIRLFELATHRSGLPRYPCNMRSLDTPNPFLNYTEKSLILSVRDESIKSKNCKIASRPTSEIAYSNWGMSLLEVALFSKLSKSFAELLEEWVTIPLEMPDTKIALSGSEKKRLAPGHLQDLKEVGLPVRMTMFGSGGILSTAHDLMNYGKALLDPEKTPLKKSLTEVLKLQYRSGNLGVAYGWIITPQKNFLVRGYTVGYTGLFKGYPEKKKLAFYLSNSQDFIKCFVPAVEGEKCN